MATEPSPKFMTIARALSDRAGAGPVDWTQLPTDSWGNQQGFEMTLTRFTVELKSENGDNSYPFTLSVRGKNGEIIDSLTTTGPSNDPTNLKALYSSLHRRLSGTDEALSQVMQELQINEPPF